MTERLRWDTLTTLDPLAAEAVAGLVRGAAEEDGFDALNESALLSLRHTNPGTTHVVAWTEDTLAGYAQLQGVDDHPVHDRDEGHAREGHARGQGEATGALVVAPQHRRTGVGTRLIETLRAVAGSPGFQIWAPHDTSGAAALAARQQMARVRELMIMMRPLTDPVPAPVIAPGITIRTFDPRADADAEAWLKVNARAFAHHPEQGAITASDLAEREAEEWFDADGFFLALREADQALLGYHWTKEHGGGLGEVYVLGVDPDSGGQGLGKALLRTGLQHLADGGDTRVLLYVEADHPNAVGLYAAHGFVEASRDVLYATPTG